MVADELTEYADGRDFSFPGLDEGLYSEDNEIAKTVDGFFELRNMEFEEAVSESDEETRPNMSELPASKELPEWMRQAAWDEKVSASESFVKEFYDEDDEYIGYGFVFQFSTDNFVYTWFYTPYREFPGSLAWVTEKESQLGVIVPYNEFIARVTVVMDRSLDALDVEDIPGLIPSPEE